MRKGEGIAHHRLYTDSQKRGGKGGGGAEDLVRPKKECCFSPNTVQESGTQRGGRPKQKTPLSPQKKIKKTEYHKEKERENGLLPGKGEKERFLP